MMPSLIPTLLPKQNGLITLVLPQLTTAGRPLTSSLALSVVKELCRYKAIDGSLR